MSTEDLIELFHHRWSAPALALLGERRGARFVELQRRLDVGRESLMRALGALIESGLVRDLRSFSSLAEAERVARDA